MLDDDLRRRAHEWAVATTTAQGLPPKVTDPVLLRQVALLLGDEPQPRDRAARRRAVRRLK